MGPLWDEKVAARMGSWFWGKESRPADKRRIYLEYPSGAPAGVSSVAAAACCGLWCCTLLRCCRPCLSC